MKARDIMIGDPRYITPDSTLQAAARLMRDGGLDGIPVVEAEGSRHVVGIITERDIAIRHVAEGHRNDCRVSDHMTGHVETVRFDDDLSDVAELMTDERIGRVPVVDGDDRLVGMIARTDLDRRDVDDTAQDIFGHNDDLTS